MALRNTVVIQEVMNYGTINATSLATFTRPPKEARGTPTEKNATLGLDTLGELKSNSRHQLRIRATRGTSKAKARTHPR